MFHPKDTFANLFTVMGPIRLEVKTSGAEFRSSLSITNEDVSRPEIFYGFLESSQPGLLKGSHWSMDGLVAPQQTSGS